MYKQTEIKDYTKTAINERLQYDSDYLSSDDIHNDLFNTDYYIVGYYDAEQWLGSHVFECIRVIKEYETDNFGEVYTDLSSSESVVNMYVYIVGEYILNEVIEEIKSEQI